MGIYACYEIKSNLQFKFDDIRFMSIWRRLRSYLRWYDSRVFFICPSFRWFILFFHLEYCSSSNCKQIIFRICWKFFPKFRNELEGKMMIIAGSYKLWNLNIGSWRLEKWVLGLLMKIEIDISFFSRIFSVREDHQKWQDDTS